MMLLNIAAAMAALAKMGAAFAASVALLGAAKGISRITQSALEALARQPEVAGDIRSNIVLMAAFIEGLAFFAIVAAIIVVFAI